MQEHDFISGQLYLHAVREGASYAKSMICKLSAPLCDLSHIIIHTVKNERSL